MWIRVRSMDGKKMVRIDGLSKLTKIEDLRQKLIEDFDAEPKRQRLFCKGKQLEDGHTLYDYSVVHNELLQILISAKVVESSKEEASDEEEKTSDKENQEPNAGDSAQVAGASSSAESETEPEIEEGETTYRKGDIIDVRDEEMGCWFEAKIVKITRNKKKGEEKVKEKEEVKEKKEEDVKEDDDVVMTGVEEPKADQGVQKDDGFLYHIIFEAYEDDAPIPVPVCNVRPRARVLLALQNVEPGQRVMLNYNYDTPEERGYWYDAIVTKINKKSITATVFVGKNLCPMKDCTIKLVNELFAIEKAGDQLNIESGASSPTKRTNKPSCDNCGDNARRKCRECGCHKCGDKKDPDLTIMCDECDAAWHIYCLNPPLKGLPEEDEWFCPLCKLDDSEVVKAGEKLKESKRKAKMPAAQASGSKRDWGKGMACAGRQKSCTVVSGNHFGPIPGIEVGSSWKFRLGCSEAGVHRPPVSGIAGKALEGAQSIVLSGGYEDDKDDGDVFTYTGSGGRDLSGNKRTAEQSCDQVLTKMNLALARNVAAPLNKTDGADAGDDWKKGKPTRVVRNYKGAKHSQYAPEDGNRYDGIYKIKRYWPEKGKSGFIVWRYEMRRDDPVPPPWTQEGKDRIAELGLEMQYPDGFLENEEAKEQEKQKKEKEKEKEKGKGKGKGKRKRIDSGSSSGSGAASDDKEETPAKEPASKKKAIAYKLPAEIKKLIDEDCKINQARWESCLTELGETAKKFRDKVESEFTCPICQEIVLHPITTPCAHNVCKSCLQTAFKANCLGCPNCREDLGKDYKMKINETLSKILHEYFPGYENAPR